jgi:hypothetical protein
MPSKPMASIIAVKLVLTVMQASKDAIIKVVLVAKQIDDRFFIEKPSKDQHFHSFKEGERENDPLCPY